MASDTKATGVDPETGTADAVTAVAEDPAKPLTPAAERALAEAAARRQAAEEEAARAREVGGRGGLDPVRYGDWEKNGIAWDF